MLFPRDGWAQALCLGSQAVWSWRVGVTVSPLGSPQGAEKGRAWVLGRAWLHCGWAWGGKEGMASSQRTWMSSAPQSCSAWLGGTWACVFVSVGLWGAFTLLV